KSSRTRGEQSSALDPLPHGERFSLSPRAPRERVGVRGTRRRLDRCEAPVSESLAAVGPNYCMALSHSLSSLRLCRRSLTERCRASCLPASPPSSAPHPEAGAALLSVAPRCWFELVSLLSNPPFS